jgi:hypothetical protein
VEENVAWQMRFPWGVVARLPTANDAHEARPARLYFQTANVEIEPAFSYKGIRMHVHRRSPGREDVEVHEEWVSEDKNQFAAENGPYGRVRLTGPQDDSSFGLDCARIAARRAEPSPQTREPLLGLANVRARWCKGHRKSGLLTVNARPSLRAP